MSALKLPNWDGVTRLMHARRAAESDGSVLGIDIGSQVAKFILAEQRADRIDVKAAGAIAIEPGWVDRGIVQDPRALGRTLAEGLRGLEVQRARSVVAIPSNLATLRWVTLPDMPIDELREAARYKVKRHLPFPVDDAYIEATRPEDTEKDGMGQSLVIAVRREVIDSRAEVLEAAGLSPAAAELEAQAILHVVERRLSERSALWRDATLTIIDVGAKNTHMYVVQNQSLQFIRGVKFGAEQISRFIAQELDLPHHCVEEALSQYDTTLNEEGVLRFQHNGSVYVINIQAELERLTREFLRLLRYFRSLHPERSYAGILDHVLICGGLAALEGFQEYLSRSLKLRVERMRPFSGILGNFSKDTFKHIANRQEAFTVVMGLALSGFRASLPLKGESHVGREFAWARGA